jgi:UDP-N-acetylglucosamine 2-epimerase (non-hydrolysing)
VARLDSGTTIPQLERFPFIGPHGRLLLVTAHRRESFGPGFQGICRGIRVAADEDPQLHVIYPVHPNPNVREPVSRELGSHPRIHLVEPLPYATFVALLRHAWVVLTDSGGIQEEAPGLGKPVLVMRDVTERPEAVDAGTARLVGTNADTIATAIRRLRESPAEYMEMSSAKNPFGDGKAADRIVNRLGLDLVA